MADKVMVAIAEEQALERVAKAAARLANRLNLPPLTLPNMSRDPYLKAQQFNAVAAVLENAAAQLVMQDEDTVQVAAVKTRAKRGA